MTREDKIAHVAAAIYAEYGTPYSSDFAEVVAKVAQRLAEVAVDTLEALDG